jgi:hypothetical protein
MIKMRHVQTQIAARSQKMQQADAVRPATDGDGPCAGRHRGNRAYQIRVRHGLILLRRHPAAQSGDEVLGMRDLLLRPAPGQIPRIGTRP